MKKYAIIAAALLLGVACQTRYQDTSSTMDSSRGTSYGTAGMGVQSGTSSSSSSTAIDSTANHRDALQDNSSALKERNTQPVTDTEINADIGTPGLKYDKGAATDKSDLNENALPSDPEQLDKKDNAPAVQPDQNKPEESLIDPNREAQIHQEDADATLRPVEPLIPAQPVP